MTNKIFTFFFKNNYFNTGDEIEDCINSRLNKEEYEPISISTSFIKNLKASFYCDDGELCVIVVGKPLNKDVNLKDLEENL